MDVYFKKDCEKGGSYCTFHTDLVGYYKKIESDKKYESWVKNNPTTIGKKRIRPSLVDFVREVTHLFIKNYRVAGKNEATIIAGSTF